MRFALIFLAVFLCLSPYGLSQAQDQTRVRQQMTSQDMPEPPHGYVVEKITNRKVLASKLVSYGYDLFAVSEGGKKLLRLRDQDKNFHLDGYFEYLIGFDHIQDIAISDTHLFISDAQGIWKVEIETSPIATKTPTNIFPLNRSQLSGHLPIAISATGRHLYIGLTSIGASSRGHIIALDLTDNSARVHASGDWHPTQLAINPVGELWATLERNKHRFLAEIEGSALQNPLKLSPEQSPTDFLFWRSKLLIALDGSQPMIAAAQFEFGQIQPDLTPLVDGFSRPSRIVGRTEVWGAPDALFTLADGRLAFHEKTSNAIWALSEKIIAPKQAEPVELFEDAETPSQSPEVPAEDDWLWDSSIESVSQINSGSILETDELLKKAGPEEPNEE